MLRTYKTCNSMVGFSKYEFNKTCNSMVGFSKYEFNNKLFSGVTLLRVIPGVTWTQPFIYIYIYYSFIHIINFAKIDYNWAHFNI